MSPKPLTVSSCRQPGANQEPRPQPKSEKKHMPFVTKQRPVISSLVERSFATDMGKNQAGFSVANRRMKAASPFTPSCGMAL